MNVIVGRCAVETGAEKKQTSSDDVISAEVDGRYEISKPDSPTSISNCPLHFVGLHRKYFWLLVVVGFFSKIFRSAFAFAFAVLVSPLRASVIGLYSFPFGEDRMMERIIFVAGFRKLGP